MSILLRLGITGGAGFLGWHIRVHVYADRSIQAVPAGRDVFSDPAALAGFVRDKDAIVHLAGMNRGDEAEIEQTNVAPAQMLIDACERAGTPAYCSPTPHSDRDTGTGVQASINGNAGRVGARAGARFTNLVIPNVFGRAVGRSIIPWRRRLPPDRQRGDTAIIRIARWNWYMLRHSLSGFSP